MDSNRTMYGKICLVTGATSGIGAVTARELARRGARVIVVGRSRERCEATVERIEEQTGNLAVDYSLADLSSQEAIRQLAREVRERYPRLDVLVNNAGGLFAQRRESTDGIEMTFALNHLGYFFLTNLLLDTLKASAPARIVNVASDAHRMAKGIDFDDIRERKRFRGLRAYAESKLANLMFTFELARRMEGTGVTSNALHPGFVATNIFAGNGWGGWSMRLGARWFAIDPEEGAKTSIYLASSPEVEGVTGRYFYRCKPIEPSPAAWDAGAARRLWGLSEELTRLGARA